MAKNVMIEQYHLDVFIPRGLSEAETNAIRRTLDSARFQVHIVRAVRAVLRKYRSMRKTHIALTR